MFAGDHDRERAAAALQDHYVRGRLTLEELSARTGRVLAARSTADVRSALKGLPRGFELGPSTAQMVARGAVLAVCTGAYLFFSVTLLEDTIWKTGDPLSPAPTPAETKNWQSCTMRVPDTPVLTHVLVTWP